MGHGGGSVVRDSQAQRPEFKLTPVDCPLPPVHCHSRHLPSHVHNTRKASAVLAPATLSKIRSWPSSVTIFFDSSE